MKEIMRKAKKIGRKDADSKINLTHLNYVKGVEPENPHSKHSPNKLIIKDSRVRSIDAKSRDAFSKLDTLENILHKQVKMIEYLPVHIDNLNDEHI
jgi:hypothetical protein